MQDKNRRGPYVHLRALRFFPCRWLKILPAQPRGSRATVCGRLRSWQAHGGSRDVAVFKVTVLTS
jgi:hypothetical protein